MLIFCVVVEIWLVTRWRGAAIETNMTNEESQSMSES